MGNTPVKKVSGNKVNPHIYVTVDYEEQCIVLNQMIIDRILYHLDQVLSMYGYGREYEKLVICILKLLFGSQDSKEVIEGSYRIASPGSCLKAL